MPLSQLELLVGDLVPRFHCPVVWVDADGAPGGLAGQACHRMRELGWTDVSVLDGGVAGWLGERYSGMNVPSKAFGEWTERAEHTPHISATELARRQAAGESLVILDSRPMREFRTMSIPGGIDCPGAELVYRVQDLLPGPDTTVVVNCAGRTRSIIGAQSLRNAGLPNPVVALEIGTMGCELSALTLSYGEPNHALPPSPAGLAQAKAATDRVAQRFGVRTVDAATVNGRQADPAVPTITAAELATRAGTVTVIDLAPSERFRRGHIPGAWWAIRARLAEQGATRLQRTGAGRIRGPALRPRQQQRPTRRGAPGVRRSALCDRPVPAT